MISFLKKFGCALWPFNRAVNGGVPENFIEPGPSDVVTGKISLESFLNRGRKTISYSRLFIEALERAKSSKIDELQRRGLFDMAEAMDNLIEGMLFNMETDVNQGYIKGPVEWSAFEAKARHHISVQPQFGTRSEDVDSNDLLLEMINLCVQVADECGALSEKGSGQHLRK